MLKHYLRDTRSEGETFAVFLDFMSLPQKPRSETDNVLFGRALAGLSDWYSHPRTIVFKITALPAGYPDGFVFDEGSTPNTADYGGRGWCFMESSVSNMVKSSALVLDISKFTGESSSNYGTGPAHECVAGRAPPLTKEDFWEQLQRKSFTSKKADVPTVAELYNAAVDARLARATKLDYSDLGWGDAEAIAVSKLLASPVMAVLNTLYLDGNKIGDEGAKAIADALKYNAVLKLNTLWVDSSIGKHPQLVAACRAKGVELTSI